MIRVTGYSGAELAAAKNGLVMPRHRLDRVDLALLIALQEEGRLTNVELSRRIGITAPPCLRRVRTLEDRGLIRGYHADVDPKKLGFNVTAFVHVGLKSQADRDIKTFAQALHSWPIVREAYALQGEIDFLLKCIAHDLTELQTFITEVLLATTNVKNVKTSLLFDVIKQAGVPVGL
ncbi:MAG TPA: Lrp/AsnC family transcriptional regulator [Rhizomicrobium sp.]|jgi:DNA-binding Lrp family transcriptional regulator|nr:Lrp/AsnC family transcriptional regulator [Rhizomicrobium sp.]